MQGSCREAERMSGRGDQGAQYELICPPHKPRMHACMGPITATPAEPLLKSQ